MRRLAGAGLTVALLVGGVSACTGDDDSKATGTAAPKPFAATGYRGLTPGMAKDAALAGGSLEAAPVSLLDGCTDFAYKGGPAPDAARMTAEAATESASKELNAKADAVAQSAAALPTLRPGASAKESAEFAAAAAEAAKKSAADAKTIADATMALTRLMAAREAKDAAFATAGRVSFGVDGLRELVAPADARTAEGIGAGSTVAELQQAYGAKGLTPAKGGGAFDLPVEGKPGWQYAFTVSGEKVTVVALVNSTMKCA
ncbi:hypothetical protein [Kitasatospora sp. NPDC002040]|uniref:hypothetical protein n=1 Tax=Kitasatospora sp. NPDC002040 TaxID=3154661 RepID=UPI00332F18F3